MGVLIQKPVKQVECFWEARAPNCSNDICVPVNPGPGVLKIEALVTKPIVCASKTYVYSLGDNSDNHVSNTD